MCKNICCNKYFDSVIGHSRHDELPYWNTIPRTQYIHRKTAGTITLSSSSRREANLTAALTDLFDPRASFWLLGQVKDKQFATLQQPLFFFYVYLEQACGPLIWFTVLMTPGRPQQSCVGPRSVRCEFQDEQMRDAVVSVSLAAGKLVASKCRNQDGSPSEIMEKYWSWVWEVLQCISGSWISGLHCYIKSSCNNVTDCNKRLHMDWSYTEKPLSLGAKLPLPRLLGMNIFQRGYFDLFVQLGPDLCHLSPLPSWKEALSECHAIVSLSQQGDLGKVKVWGWHVYSFQEAQWAEQVDMCKVSSCTDHF